MSDWDSSYDDYLYETFSITTPTPSQKHLTPSLGPLVGEDMSDINVEDIERNSLVVIPPTQEQQPQQQQQQQMQTPSRSTNKNAGGGGQAMKNRLKTLLTLRTPQPEEATPSNQNICTG